MESLSRAPFISWGYFSTPDGRSGKATSELINSSQDIISELDWGIFAQAIIPGESVYKINLFYSEQYGQVLSLSELRYARENNNDRSASYLSSFILGYNAYFRSEQKIVVNLFKGLNLLCKEQSSYTENNKFTITQSEFAKLEIPNLGFTLGAFCKKINYDFVLPQNKGILVVKCDDKNDIVRLAQSIFTTEVFQDYSSIYFTESEQVVQNLQKICESENYDDVDNVIYSNGEIVVYREQIKKEKAENVHLNNLIAQLQEEHQTEIEGLNLQHQNYVTDLNNQYHTEIESLNNKYQNEIQSINNLNEQNITTLTNQHKNEINSLKINYANEKKGLTDKHNEVVKALKVEEKKLLSDKDSQIAKLNSDSEQLRSDINIWMQNQEAIVKNVFSRVVDNSTSYIDKHINSACEKLISDYEQQLITKLDEAIVQIPSKEYHNRKISRIRTWLLEFLLK